MNPSERVAFKTSIEGLLRAVPYQSVQMRAALKSMGIDPENLLAAYPYETFIQLMELVARELWPGLTQEDAMFQVGQLNLRGYRETLLGKAIAATARLIGPGRLLERFSRSFRTVNNYTESTARKISAQHYELEIKPARFPSYFQGLFTEVLSALGCAHAQVTLTSATDEGIRLDIRW